MSDSLADLKPEKLWALFFEMCRIPHGSKNEALLAAYICNVAQDAGFPIKQDQAGNVCIAVPATKGYERAPIVVLQGHLDMVCEKDESVVFDFLRDGVQPVRDGEWIKAQGTTLGADNGIGVAAALAVAMADDIIHGPLEILLTVDEETGLTGAARLSPSFVTGRILLNLDSEKADTVCIGCAGGGGVTARLPLVWEGTAKGSCGLRLTLTGLRGGHSGLDIHENRANSIKLLTRYLIALIELGVTIADFKSGGKHNAIPREGSVLMVLPEHNVGEAQERLSVWHALFKSEFPQEHHLDCKVFPFSLPAQVVSLPSLEVMLNMLMAFPNGVLAMSREISGLVETSANLATSFVSDGVLTVHCSARSSSPHSLQAVLLQIEAVAHLAGASTSLEESYPGWQPNPDSRILSIFEAVYGELFKTRPRREATHAGLECGVIGSTFSGMDMISFGPDIVNAHSPHEAVNILSVEKFWKLLVGVLEKVARGLY